QVLTAALGEPAVAQLPTVRRQEDPVRWLEEELKIETQGDSMIMKLSLSGDSPTDITQIVNAVREAYLREVVQKEAMQKKEQLTALEDTKGKLEAAYKIKSEDYLRRQSGLQPDGQPAGQTAADRLAMSDYTELIRELASTRSQKAKLELELQTLTARPAPSDAALFAMPGSPDLPPPGNSPEERKQKEYEARLARTKAMLAHKVQMVPNPDSHPDVVAFRTGLERMQQDH